jgi:hypothetical protein
MPRPFFPPKWKLDTSEVEIATGADSTSKGKPPNNGTQISLDFQ